MQSKLKKRKYGFVDKNNNQIVRTVEADSFDNLCYEHFEWVVSDDYDVVLFMDRPIDMRPDKPEES